MDKPGFVVAILQNLDLFDDPVSIIERIHPHMPIPHLEETLKNALEGQQARLDMLYLCNDIMTTDIALLVNRFCNQRKKCVIIESKDEF